MGSKVRGEWGERSGVKNQGSVMRAEVGVKGQGSVE